MVVTNPLSRVFFNSSRERSLSSTSSAAVSRVSFPSISAHLVPRAEGPTGCSKHISDGTIYGSFLSVLLVLLSFQHQWLTFFYCFPLLSSHTFYLHPSRSAGKVFPLCLCCRFCACFTLFPLFVSWRTQRRMEEQQVIRVKVQLFCSAVTLLHRRNPAAQKGNEQFQFPLHNTKKETGVYSYRKHWRRFAVITPR